MDPIRLENTLNKLKLFVENFNANTDFIKYSIVAIQFVSIIDVNSKELYWWTLAKKSLANKYKNCVLNFTGLSKGDTVEKTLIFSDHWSDIYWYEKLGENEISIINSEEYEFSTHKDKIGIHNSIDNVPDVKICLPDWKEVLEIEFDGSGSTMWISIPHTDELDFKIFSSAFILFKNGINQTTLRNKIYKYIRDFIIDYLIELYSRKAIESIERNVEKIDSQTINSFKVKQYFPSKILSFKQEETIAVFESKFYPKNNPQTLIQLKTLYNDVLKYLLEIRKGKEMKPFGLGVEKFPKFSTSAIKIHSQFHNFLKGRLLFLSAYVVLGKNYKQSLEFLFMTLHPHRAGFSTLNEFKKRLCLAAIKNDDKNGYPQTDHSYLKNTLSEAELDFIESLFLKLQQFPYHRNIYTDHFLA